MYPRVYWLYCQEEARVKLTIFKATKLFAISHFQIHFLMIYLRILMFLVKFD